MAGRMGEIAICGALFAMRPPTYIQYAIRAARLKLHPHLTIPPSRPAGGTRSRIFLSAAPALIGCTHQPNLISAAALEAAKDTLTFAIRDSSFAMSSLAPSTLFPCHRVLEVDRDALS